MQEKAIIQDFLRKHGNVNRPDREQRIALVQAVARIPWGEGRTIEEVLETKHVGTGIFQEPGARRSGPCGPRS